MRQKRKKIFACLIGIVIFLIFAFLQSSVLNSIGLFWVKYYNMHYLYVGFLSAFFNMFSAILFYILSKLSSISPTRKLLFFTCFSMIFSLMLLSFMPEFIFSLFLYASLALGYAIGMISVWHYAYYFFPEKKSLMLGGSTTAMLLGGIVGQTPSMFILSNFGIKLFFLLDATFGLLILIIIFTLGSWPETVNKITNKVPRNFIKKDNTIFYIIYVFSLNLPILILGDSHGQMLLSTLTGISIIQSANCTLALFVGLSFGCIFFGMLADNIPNRLIILCLSPIVIALLTLCLLIVKKNYLTIASLMLLLGIFSASQSLIYPMLMDKNSPDFILQKISSVTFLILLCSSVTQFILSFVLNFVNLASYCYILLITIVIFNMTISFLLKDKFSTKILSFAA